MQNLKPLAVTVVLWCCALAGCSESPEPQIVEVVEPQTIVVLFPQPELLTGRDIHQLDIELGDLSRTLWESSLYNAPPSASPQKIRLLDTDYYFHAEKHSLTTVVTLRSTEEFLREEAGRLNYDLQELRFVLSELYLDDEDSELTFSEHELLTEEYYHCVDRYDFLAKAQPDSQLDDVPGLQLAAQQLIDAEQLLMMVFEDY